MTELIADLIIYDEKKDEGITIDFVRDAPRKYRIVIDKITGADL